MNSEQKAPAQEAAMETLHKTDNQKTDRQAPISQEDKLDICPQVPDLVPSFKKKKKVLVSVFASVVLAGAISGGIALWNHVTAFEETDDAVIQGRIHQLSSRVNGTITKLNVDDNQHVKSGQVLVEIDPTDYKISMNTASAALAQAELKSDEIKSNILQHQNQYEARQFEADSAINSARANVEKAKAALSESKLGVGLAKAQVEQREAELKRADLDYRRYIPLAAEGAVTMQSFDKVKQDKDVAAANLQVAKEACKQAHTRVEQAQEALKDAQANVTRAAGSTQMAQAAQSEMEASKHNLRVQAAAAAQARSQLENARTQLSYTSVKAPITGRIGHRTVEVGQQIERGQALMSVVSDDKWVVANFKETQLAHMRPGQKVDIHVDAFPDAHLTGTVESMSPASGAQFALLPPDNATGNFTKVVQRVPVKIILDKDSLKGYENLLAPGMSVLPKVHLK